MQKPDAAKLTSDGAEFPVSARWRRDLDDDGEWAVIHAGHLHHGAEDARLDGRAAAAQFFHQLDDQRLCPVARSRQIPGWPSALVRPGVKGELTDHQ